MDIRTAIDWLDSHIGFEGSRPGSKPTHSQRSPMPEAGVVDGLSLTPMRELLAALGNPHESFRSIHITGTNGKGSTARMAAAVLTATELSVGIYTSPDLHRINERISWGSEPIGDDDLARVLALLASVEPLLKSKPTRFEFLTAAAFVWFAEIAVDIAVVEVGMLGTHDATNVIEADVAVITNLGKDHTSGAEGWRDAIASEKSGIIKPNSHVILGSDMGEQHHFFSERDSIELWQNGVDFEVEQNEMALGGRIVDIRTPAAKYNQIFVPFHGAHQTQNLATALAAVEAFFSRPVDDALVDTALATLDLPGRFEIVSREPTIILDGAHNVHGARASISTLNSEFARFGSRLLVVGLLRGKEPQEMLEALDAEDFDAVICTQPRWSRALPAEELGAVASELNLDPEIVPDPVAAFERALAVTAPEDVIFVTGSLYLLGDIRGSLMSAIENTSR